MTDAESPADPAALKRLYWHSRRGMLELDLLLVPFAQRRLPELGADELQGYKQLLQQEDQDIHAWLTRREPAPSAVLQRIVELILADNAARGRRGHSPG